MMPEDRLRQAEALLETAARYITRHEEAILRHEESMVRLDERMLELVDMFSELATITRDNQQEIRRIWEYLSAQSGNGRSST